MVELFTQVYFPTIVAWWTGLAARIC